MKPGTLYLHVIEWPEDGRLVISDFDLEVSDARLLGQPDTLLPLEEQRGTLVIQGPIDAPDKAVSVVALSLT
jgi:hypothetical protein